MPKNVKKSAIFSFLAEDTKIRPQRVCSSDFLPLRFRAWDQRGSVAASWKLPFMKKLRVDCLQWWSSGFNNNWGNFVWAKVQVELYMF